MQFICVDDFEREAKRRMAKKALDYYQSGADDELTLRANREIFSDFRIMPRFLRDVSNIHLPSTIFGHKITCPLGVSPTAMHKLAHPEGELATAEAVNRFGSIMTLSTLSSTPIEEIAGRNPTLIKWFQLYLFVDRQESLKLINRAEAAGFDALVLTVDAAQFGTRRADLRNGFHVPASLMANFSQKNDQSIQSLDYIDASIQWSDVEWLCKVTSMRIIIKGILTPEDALLALEYGASGIVVSNHGGRQLDSAPASVSKTCEVLCSY